MKVIEDKSQDKDQNKSVVNCDILSNFFRCLSMLEKTLERLARQRWHDEKQYPQIYFDLLFTIAWTRTWIENYKIYSDFQIFQDSLMIHIANITDQISTFIETSHFAPGKKKSKKTRRKKQQAEIQRSINLMLDHLIKYPGQFEKSDTQIGDSMKKALAESFEKSFREAQKKRRQHEVVLSQRGEKSFIFPWEAPMTYHELVEDPNRFRKEVVNNLKHYQHDSGHKSECKCRGSYKMKGFRNRPRKTVVPGGHKEAFRIRMVECSDCGQRFSLLPSFIPREKHYAIDIIGNVIRGIVLFGESLSAAFEKTEICGRKLKSRQTVLNWLQWAGNVHPATLLSRCNAECRGYFQEDEGFEKEPGLRTYTVVMSDPETQLVWHMDYVDHVDEKTLCASFENFLQQINFSVKGVTKDKWKPSTKALKSVFYKVWIGFCHLHFLKKLSKAFVSYQKETGRPWKEVNELQKKIKKILDTATHARALKAQLKGLNDKAFSYPAIKDRIEDLRDNAVHYTSHKQRNGITTTTSIVDNFLKNVKRKLKQIESFRDKILTRSLFYAMANIRNFVPFMPGAKNAGKSPFELAGGETYGMKWMQVINMHNGFSIAHNTL